MGENAGRRTPVNGIVWLALAAALAAATWVAWRTGAVSWDSVAHRSQTTSDFVNAHFAAAAALYVAVYVLAAALLWPAQLWIILAGGFFFGLGRGACLSWVGAMAGAACVYVIARSSFRVSYERRNIRMLDRLRAEFAKDSLLYMLALRWIPVSPYSVANAVPPLLGARLRPFMAVASVGVLPDVITYSLIGSGAGALLSARAPPDLSALSSRFLPVLVALGAAPLLALLVRRLARARRRALPDDLLS